MQLQAVDFMNWPPRFVFANFTATTKYNTKTIALCDNYQFPG